MLTWSRKFALLQFCKIRQHLNVRWNHFTEICCYNPDVGAVTLMRFSNLKCSVQSKTFFLMCSMRQCMSEVWLSATGL